MNNGKYHLRAPNGRPVKYPRILCTTLRAKDAKHCVRYQTFAGVPVKQRCKLCNAIFKRLGRKPRL